MARNNQRGGTAARRSTPKDLGRRVKKKPCALCRDKVEWVDYKDVPMLRKYMSDRGKIRSRRVTGNCAQHQRALAMAIKTARELVLLPYTQRTVTERPGGRGGGRDRGERTLGDSMPAEAPRQRSVDTEVPVADAAPAAPAEPQAESEAEAEVTAQPEVAADVAEALAVVNAAVADAEAGARVEVVVEPGEAGAEA
jgi:small subunit ribosomal protein S18